MSRLKHGKRTRKLLTYFRAAHGFRPPFDVLLDGTAIQAGLNHGVELTEVLAKVLCEKVRLHVPRAVVAELHALGRDFSAAAKFSRRLKVLDSAAPTGKAAAADALVALVANGNPQRRFVLTEDPALRERLSACDAVPLLRFVRGGRVILEAPGKLGGGADDDKEEDHDHDTHRGTSGIADGAAATKNKRPRPDDTVRSTSAAAASASEAAAQPPKKRRKFKEPNPLSVKKKKKPSQAAAASGATAVAGSGDSGASGGKARRRNRRSGGGGSGDE